MIAYRKHWLLRRGKLCGQLALTLVTLNLDSLARGQASTAPAVSSAATAQVEESKVEAYPLNNSTREVLTRWQQQTAGRSDIRVAIDDRTGQALVFAPPTVQVQLHQQLAATAPPATAPQASVPQTQATANANVGLAVPGNAVLFQLRQVPAAEIHGKLESLLSRSLPATVDASGDWQSFPLEASPNARVMMSVNIRAAQVRLDGQPAQVAAWRAVVEALDSPPATPDHVTKLVSTKPNNSAQVRQALQVIMADGANRAGGQPSLVSTIFQPQAKPAVDALAQAAPPAAAPAAAPAAPAPAAPAQPPQPGETKLAPGSAQTAIDAAKIAEAAGGLMGPVQVEYVEGLDVIVLRGAERDVQRVMDIIKQIEDLSTVTVPEITIHPLKYVDSVQVAGLLQTLYQQVLGPRIGTVNITPLGKPNALLLIGRKENVKMAIDLVDRLDQPVIPTSRFEVFTLKHATATEAKTLVENFLGQAQGQALPQFPGGAGNPANNYVTLAPRALVVADQRSNSLVVSASPRDIAEIAALIQRIDVAGAAAELKVFTIVNGDSTALTEMLRSLFSVSGSTPSGTGDTGSLGQTSPVRMQFSVDHRTNSIIAVGTKEDLAVVEAILLRLDEGDLRERKTTVFRLNNAFAENVAQSLNQWLQTERQVETQTQATISPFEQIEREVIIVPELATNSLIVSATPRFFNEVVKIVKDLDERPPMVLIQVLIAQVALNDTDQFGVELGLQDSVLFDRSLLSDVQQITTTTTTQSAGGATVQTTQQNVINANGQPGFNWNSPTAQPLGNNLSSNAVATAGTVGAQGLANFAMNRVDPTLGFSGFVFSASSDAVSILLRALQEKRRLEVLSRPQLMALDGQQGTVQVGQQVPTVTGISQTTFGQTNNIIYRDVGLILNLIPRISPDGLVVMQIMAEKSQVSTEAGVPIGFSSNGQALNAPIIDTTRALTTISATSGQTVILGGLIETTKSDIHRRVPIIADIPLLGNLFRYDSVAEGRREVLIILTPQIVYNKMDSDLVKQIESSRMSWILSDVVNVHGEAGLRSRCDEWGEGEMDSIYPSVVPPEGLLPLSPSQATPGCEPALTAPGGGSVIPNGSQPTPSAEPIPTPSARKSPNNDRPANASYETAAVAPRVAPVAFQPAQAAATVSR